MSNLLYVGNNKDKAPMAHPSYLSYRQHYNIVKFALNKIYGKEDADKISTSYIRSDFSEQAIVADYLRGDVPKHPIIHDSHLEHGIKLTTQAFSPSHKYRPVSFPDLRYYPWTLPTSAEAPYSTSPYWKEYVQAKYRIGLTDNNRLTFHNLYNEIFVANRLNVHRIKDGYTTDIHGNDLKYFNHIHARSHLVETGKEEKIRAVYGVPKLLLQVECMFLWPLINDLLNRKNGPMLWGSETLQGGWYQIYNWISSSEDHYRTFLAFDWKQFDKRIQFNLVDLAHNIFYSFIDLEHGYVPTQDYPETWTEPERLNRLWRWMCDAIKHTPDILPNGDTYIRQHAGIASGYFQTQILDSICNYIMLTTCLSEMGINIEAALIKVQGDDSLIALKEYIPPSHYASFKEQYAHIAKQRFGSILNESKSSISNSLNGLPVLGFTNIGGFPTRSDTELLASLLYPERKSDENRLMARTIGIAYANCGYHPKVYRVCEDIYNYLHKLGFTPNLAGMPQLITSTLDWRESLGFNTSLAFPTYFETIRRLSDVPSRSESQKRKMWPQQFISNH
uniref:RdRp n=1 Tax=Hubei partiti-like virus 26 TaxID=1923033 RepID=A0A1L3KLN1_9VIRU|nr:RdRp [Hubei partiti-like virus 26]